MQPLGVNPFFKRLDSDSKVFKASLALVRGSSRHSGANLHDIRRFEASEESGSEVHFPSTLPLRFLQRFQPQNVYHRRIQGIALGFKPSSESQLGDEEPKDSDLLLKSTSHFLQHKPKVQED